MNTRFPNLGAWHPWRAAVLPLAPLAAAMLGLVAMVGGLGAENRALLVAVPETPHIDPKDVAPLEGPSNDVSALRQALIDRWGFRDSGIRILDGAASTRASILEALDQLADATSAEDHLLVYFSGHGTSAFSEGGLGLGLPRNTGALVPTDIRLGSEEETLGGLIIGSRDLRPRFERLDRSGAEILVLFDSCYSGDAARSIPRLVARSAELFPRRTTVPIDELIGEGSMDKPWPYERVIYISAAARHELAFEIPATDAVKATPTIDGRAHGVFTDGLLRALRGDADRDRDGRIVYSELHEFLVGHVLKFGQTPQLRPRSGGVVDKPVFGWESAPARPPGEVAPSVLRVRLEPADATLSALLAKQDGIALTEGVADLEVRRESQGDFRVYVAGSDLGIGLGEPAEVAELLRTRVPAQRIANLKFPAQDLRLAIQIEPDQAGVYYRRDKLNVALRSGEAAWLLLLAIDARGGVLPVYPINSSQARAAGGTEPVRVAVLQVTAPYGTDLLEAFAFRDKPDGYDEWIGREETLNLADTERLYAMLRTDADKPGRARASRIVYTLDR